ncbi:MAG: FAD-binding protein, partial [Peptococcaceae bacterium]|nr:FAD-binding protein [Peptococcaceae bacterium]
VVLDQLNRHLAPLGLMFAPDVSTSDRATIGGMIGNNSAGARSLRYGKTVDHVRSLDVVLDDGTPARFEPLDVATLQQVCRHGDLAGILHATVRDVVARHEAAIRAQFPRILRRVSGYNLDEFVPGLAVRPAGWPDEPWQFNLSRLIVGSEGTLAIVTGAELRVVPKPACTGLVVLSFASINDALGRIEEMVAAGLMVKEAGMELSEYVLMGIGGPGKSREHALASAGVLNAIDPHFIRIRTFIPRPGSPLFEKCQRGEFQLVSPHGILNEIRLMIENLRVNSQVFSDHVSNYWDISGKLPEERELMLQEIDMALDIPEALLEKARHGGI